MGQTPPGGQLRKKKAMCKSVQNHWHRFAIHAHGHTPYVNDTTSGMMLKPQHGKWQLACITTACYAEFPLPMRTWVKHNNILYFLFPVLDKFFKFNKPSPTPQLFSSFFSLSLCVSYFWQWQRICITVYSSKPYSYNNLNVPNKCIVLLKLCVLTSVLIWSLFSPFCFQSSHLFALCLSTGFPIHWRGVILICFYSSVLLAFTHLHWSYTFT